jgi:hypothetical protein
MPDHVHLIFTPLIDNQKREVCSLAQIMNAIKGASAHKINKALHRSGRVWQAESFDHVVRSSESLDSKVQYLLENPVRKCLANRWQEYPWIWQKTSKNPYAPQSALRKIGFLLISSRLNACRRHSRARFVRKGSAAIPESI